jgi:hypothetical protein
MTHASINTSDICEYFLKGDITTLPDEHIKLILHKLFSRLQRGLSDEDTKQKRIDCIKKYVNNHALMAERYLKIMKKLNAYAKHYHLNTSEQYKKQHKHNMKMYSKERYNKIINLDSNEIDKTNKYYTSLFIYYVGFIEYENEKLDVYCNIPLKHRHHTLKSFNTIESDKYHEYYFRNDKLLILPEQELIDILYTKFDIYKLD